MSTLIVCIVFEKETEECLAVWLKDEVVPALFTEVGATGNQNPILLYLPMEKDTLGELVSSRVAGTIQECTAQQNNGSFVCLLLSVFWDGTTEESKSVFSNLKKFSVSDSTEFQGLQSSLGDTKLEFLLQALNAKKGQHNMKNNETALINSLQGKVKKAALWANDGQATTSPSIKKESTGGSADGHLGMLDISPEALGAAASQAQGECFVVVASPTKEGLLERVTTLRDNAEKANLGVSAVLLDPREVVVSQEPKKTEWAQEFLLRKTCSGGGHIQMRLAMCGNVDSGKSTLTSVLTRGCRDDGRGFARAFVFNHKHESVTGRTSSISENHLGFTATGEVVNYQLGGATQSHTPATLRSFTPQELSSRSSKVLTLYDLAGHEKYLKTTVLGMTRNMPDYSCIVVSGNNGIQRMTKEHLALCLALKLPFFIVVTRIDSTPANVMKETLDNINKLMKIPTVKKLPYPITTHDEMILAAKNLKNDRIAPIFRSVT
ncbi:GTP-binding protein elongation factor tu family protein [Angomonas deanei]|uniref:Elongation factor Tu GTP binding domain containing protein, putative n=1 Tax=Angomonas deanei TaxID=59799 RepID=A0A7G2CNQ9_9TRYP|nr:GTP-binding protein elongation factor tu family protein [Angomonas deanei]CAD2221430.1 Elongation factor Tu GTP binding domain containing protein, putative [Angomonas deanei]|eukprot:EPY30206.1 GTP-binding protein elongation factor tu family protein [Angomonas deanei]